MSIQNPLENYGLERIRMEEDDRYVWVYYAGKVENVVNKLTKENEELKTKLEDVQATAYAESVDAWMENRKLKRALWLARADRAVAAQSVHEWCRYNEKHPCGLWKADPFECWVQAWICVEKLCRKKAKEYK